MRTPSYTTQFERDLRLLQRRGKDIEKLKEVLKALINEELLAERYRDHPLKGNYKNRRECHLEPDWLLISECFITPILVSWHINNSAS